MANTKYKRILLQYDCPRELVDFIEYMALTKCYVVDTAIVSDYENAKLYQWSEYDHKFSHCPDIVHIMNWRFKDFTNFDNGREFVDKTLNEKGIRRVLWGLCVCFHSAKMQVLFSDAKNFYE